MDTAATNSGAPARHTEDGDVGHEGGRHQLALLLLAGEALPLLCCSGATATRRISTSGRVIPNGAASNGTT